MKRLLLVLGAVLLAFGLGAVPAYAGTGNQFCTTSPAVACFNAWNGGPYVNVYTARGTAHNDFTLGYDSTLGVYYLEYTGGGAWNGQCIGDASNDSGNYQTSLDPCPSGSNSGGWGTHFSANGGCANGGLGFKNIHWNGYIWPVNYSNGSPFFLNGGNTEFCYVSYPAA